MKPESLLGRVAPWLVGVGLVLYGWFALSSINKPLTTDEVEFAGGMLAVAKTGRPVYYMGDNPMPYVAVKDRWVYEQMEKPMHHYMLFHSPLYVYLGALFVKVFGMTNWAPRLVGMISFFATLWLLRGILFFILPAEKARGAFGLAAFLYLINPLLLQQGLMLDLDNTIVTATCVLYLHEFLRLERRKATWWRKYGWLSVVMAVVFWAKEFPGFYLALAVMLYTLAQRRWRETLGVLLSLVAGVALFWSTWWLFAKLNHLPVMFFIRYTTIGILGQGEGLFTTLARESGLGNAVLTVLFSLFHLTVWQTPFYWLLLVLVIVWRVREFWTTKQLGPLDLVLLYAVMVLGVTQVYRPSGWFLKYSYPAHAVMMVLFGALLGERLAKAERHDWVLLGVGVLVMAGAQAAMLQDSVLSFFGGRLRGVTDAKFWGFYAVAAAGLFMVIKLARSQWSVASSAALAAGVGLAGASLSLNWFQRASYVTSISWNNYGEQGFNEAVNYLKSVVRPDEVLICRKDFGFALYKDLEVPCRKWYNPCVLDAVKSPNELVQNITGTGVKWIVLDRYAIGYSSMNRRVPVLQIVGDFYRLDKQFGNFYVLRRK